jgi:glutamate-1-semialdehyde 2,1-aminomutase
VKPDITTLGKILGGGFPIGCIASSLDIMEKMAPLGNVYQAGTFNGNPISMTAGLAALTELEKEGTYEMLESQGSAMRKGLLQLSEDVGVETRVYGAGSMFQMYFTNEAITDYSSALRSDKNLFLNYQRELLKQGVFLPPSQFECNFISTAHTEEIIDSTLEKMEESLRKVI